MRVAVWPGHVGKPLPDPGACGDAGCEGDWTAELAALLTLELRRVGHHVVDLGLGEYVHRARAADELDAELVLHLHGDTGEPAAWHYPGSRLGAPAALRLARALDSVLPWRLDVREARAGAVPRANGLLGLTRAPAVLLELVRQTDAEQVRHLRAALPLVAQALARGVGGG